MRELPTMSKTNMPPERTLWDNLRAKVDSEMTGMDEAFRVVSQARSYKSGQLDMFPHLLAKESSLFLEYISDEELEKWQE